MEQAHGLTQLVITGRIPADHVTTTLAAFLGPGTSAGGSTRQAAAAP